MPNVQKMWVWFNHFSSTAHCKLLETIDLTVQYYVIHHADMVRDVVAVLQEVKQQ